MTTATREKPFVRAPRNTSEVMHAWANQTRADGRAASVSFNGTALYSYNALIAALVTNKKGQTAALLTTRKWSITTTGHQSAAASASSHLPQFHVLDCGRDFFGHGLGEKTHQVNVADYRARIEAAVKVLARCQPRNREWHLSQVHDIVAEARRYVKFFGLRCKVDLPKDFDPDNAQATIDHYKRLHAAEVRREEKRRREEAARRARKYAEQLTKWRTGEGGSIGPDADGYDSLRLRAQNTLIETTSGAVVKVETAKAVLPLVRARRMVRNPVDSGGGPVVLDGFAVRLVDDFGTLHVGCHKIKREEIERIAAQMGL